MRTTPTSELLLSLEVQQFVAHEVALLDARRFEEWLELFSDDVRYWMPALATTDDPEHDLAGPDALGWFDEDLASLTLRVRRLSSPQAHAEHPASRTRRFVFVTALEHVSDDELSVSANFAIYRSRRERDSDLFVGARTDLLRRHDAGFEIASRSLQLDQNIVHNRDMSILF